MKIKWFGMSAFSITAAGGVRIITDPYVTSGTFTYDPVNEMADVVTVSHQHTDHNHLASVLGDPVVISEPSTQVVKGIAIRGVPSHHDNQGGAVRGNNTIFCFQVDGLRLCHLGDLGHLLTPAQIAEIGDVDVLLLPVGGHFTIDPGVAGEVRDSLAPRITIPMHYRTPKWANPDIATAGVDVFLDGKTGVRRLAGSEIEVTPEIMTRAPGIVVLAPAR